ncbi:hypothetical protein D9M68_461340 [compost metagenome]
MGVRYGFLERRVRSDKRCLAAQADEGWECALQFVGTNPACIFDPRLVVGDRLRRSGVTIKPGAAGHPGREQVGCTIYADFPERRGDGRVGHALGNARDVERLWFDGADEQRLVQLGRPERGMRETVEEAAHEHARVLVVLSGDR